MEFIAYRFDCWPIHAQKTPFEETDSELEDLGQNSFENRKDIINSFFNDTTDLSYTLGDGSHPPFRMKKHELVLRRYKLKKPQNEESLLEQKIDEEQTNEIIRDSYPEEEASKLPKLEQDTLHAARIIYHNDGVTILRVQKKRPMKGEDRNYQTVEYKENYVSSLVVLVVRDGLQYILIEDSSRTFPPATLSLIMESTLNRLLMTQYRLAVDVNPVRRVADFWRILTDKQLKGCQVKRLRFKFDYPNMPWPDTLLGGRFKRLGMDLNAEAEINLKGQHGEPLKIVTLEGERDPDINDMMVYSCDKGNVAYAYFTDGTYTTFGWKQTGDVKVELPNGLKEMQKNQDPKMFPEDYNNTIIQKAKSVRDMNKQAEKS